VHILQKGVLQAKYEYGDQLFAEFVYVSFLPCGSIYAAKGVVV
jgi:hypothetical protein